MITALLPRHLQRGEGGSPQIAVEATDGGVGDDVARPGHGSRISG